MSFGEEAAMSADQAEWTSYLAVRRAMIKSQSFCLSYVQRKSPSGDVKLQSLKLRLTSINEGNGFVDSLLGVSLEDLCHVREWWFPFKCVSQISMCSHGAKKTT